MDSEHPRQPLKDLKNVQSDKNRPPPALKKAGVNRKSLIAKHSSIPKPPRSNRHSTVRQVKVESTQELPPPSRISTKPRRTANASFRQISRNPIQSDPSRRSAASMNFTQCASSTRTGLSGRRASQQEDVSNYTNPVAVNHFDISSIPQAIGEALKEAMKARLDEDRRAELEDIVKKHINTISNDNINSQAAETLRLQSELVNLQFRLRDAENQAVEERNRANSTESKAVELRNEITSLQDSQKAPLQADPGELESLRNQLNQSLDSTNELEKQVESLQKEIALKREKLVEYDRKVEDMSSELKDAMFRTERVQTDLSCRESEIRRIKREKEELQSERDNLLNTIKKRSCSLQEERQVGEGLRNELERSKNEWEKTILNAEANLLAYKQEVEPSLASLEQEKKEFQRKFDLTTSELKNRVEELDSVKETVSLLESKISHLSCERTSFKIKIEALNEANAKASKEITDLSDSMRKQREEIHLLEQQAREDASTRRKLHNTIQELKGNIRVFARIRPSLHGEMFTCGSDDSLTRDIFEYTERGQGVTAMTPGIEGTGGAGLAKRSRYPFKFDRVFDPTATQETVFEEISELVQSALDGYGVCIFAYGQTGSGKTYTMLGNGEGGEQSLGMIPRSVRQIFDTAKSMEKDEWTFRLKASFLEIYNEVIRDLLIDPKSSSQPKRKETRSKEEQHKVHFNPETRLSTVQDLTIEEVKNESQLHRLIDLSMQRRATAATKANERSSRSHSVFRLYIEGSNNLTGEKRRGLLNLIDLAGSERLSHSKAEGDRLRETRNINRSLSALGDVISALANRDKHVPFRNSKLTHVLQDSLGGDSKTLMFVNISHAPESFHESLTSLRFAAKVNSCHVGTAKRSTRIEL